MCKARRRAHRRDRLPGTGDISVEGGQLRVEQLGGQVAGGKGEACASRAMGVWPRGGCGQRQPRGPPPRRERPADAHKRAAAGMVFQAKSDGERVGVTVRCEPSPDDSLGVPPPFRCGSVGDQFDCGDLDALVSLWLCQPPLAPAPVNGSAEGDAALAAR